MSFSRDGRELVVTERDSNTIVTVPIESDGSPASNPSSGAEQTMRAVAELRERQLSAPEAGYPAKEVGTIRG